MPVVPLTLLLVMPEVLHRLLLLTMQAEKEKFKRLIMQVETHVQTQIRNATLSLIQASTVHTVTGQDSPS